MPLTDQDKKDLINLMADMLDAVVLPQIQEVREAVELNRKAIDKNREAIKSNSSDIRDLTKRMDEMTSIIQSVRHDQLEHKLRLDEIEQRLA